MDYKQVFFKIHGNGHFYKTYLLSKTALLYPVYFHFSVKKPSPSLLPIFISFL